MNTAENTEPENETQIRQLIADWTSALCAKDLDRMMAHYAPDVIVFDAIPPFQTAGAAALRRAWEMCFPCFPDSFKTEMRELGIIVTGDEVALAHWLWRFTGMEEGHPAQQTWLRATVGYRKQPDGRWLIVHEHASVPFDPITSQAAFTLDPGSTEESRELVLTRVIDASPARVFQAWTDPTQVTQWWGPHGMTVPVCEMDLRPGGVFRTVMRAPDGAEYPNTGYFAEITEPARLSFTDKLDEDGKPSPEAFMLATITFEELEGKTKLTARALHYSDANREKHEQMGFHKGWGEMLERLEAQVVEA